MRASAPRIPAVRWLPSAWSEEAWLSCALVRGVGSLPIHVTGGMSLIFIKAVVATGLISKHAPGAASRSEDRDGCGKGAGGNRAI